MAQAGAGNMRKTADVVGAMCVWASVLVLLLGQVARGQQPTPRPPGGAGNPPRPPVAGGGSPVPRPPTQAPPAALPEDPTPAWRAAMDAAKSEVADKAYEKARAHLEEAWQCVKKEEVRVAAIPASRRWVVTDPPELVQRKLVTGTAPETKRIELPEDIALREHRVATRVAFAELFRTIWTAKLGEAQAAWEKKDYDLVLKCAEAAQDPMRDEFFNRSEAIFPTSGWGPNWQSHWKADDDFVRQKVAVMQLAGRVYELRRQYDMANAQYLEGINWAKVNRLSATVVSLLDASAGLYQRQGKPAEAAKQIQGICDLLAKDPARAEDLARYQKVLDALNLAAALAQDTPASMKWYLKAAEGGDAGAMNRVGLFYARGKVVERDPDVALKWFLKAADSGDKYGMQNVALMHHNGSLKTGVNEEEALKWFKAASEKGLRVAMLTVGDAYWDGWAGKVDFAAGLEYYRKAAEAGNAPGMRMVGRAYAEAKGVEQDLKQAFVWMERAAVAGDAPATSYVAKALEKGDGVAVDLDKAKVWKEKEAEFDQAVLNEILKPTPEQEARAAARIDALLRNAQAQQAAKDDAAAYRDWWMKNGGDLAAMGVGVAPPKEYIVPGEYGGGFTDKPYLITDDGEVRLREK